MMRRKRPTPNESTERGGLDTLGLEAGLPVLHELSDEQLDSSLVKRLPVQWVRDRIVLPIRFDGEVKLLVADPGRPDDLHYAEMVTGLDMDLMLASPELIRRAIDRCYAGRSEQGSDDTDEVDSDPAEEISLAAGGAEDLLNDDAAPVARVINQIVLAAVERGASDIHFEPEPGLLRVRYRVDGRLYAQSSPPARMRAALVSRLKVMARMDISERRLPQDGMAQVRVGQQAIDIRVSTVPIADGERVVLRLLNRDQAYLPLVSLGMSSELQSRFAELLNLPHGMVLVCGPTGAGKTTTLYSALANLDSEHKNILTIEDPVEYRLPGIGQIQVKPKIGLSFSAGLRHILRQDPDVVLVGETRDRETAEIAVQASLTGHLVFTTLHTNDAPSSILRLVDMGIERYLVASCLRAVLAQRLVRSLCDSCKRRVAWSEDGLTSAEARLSEWLKGRDVWEAVGCDACIDGYRGRSGLFELLVPDASLRVAMRDNTLDADALNLLARKSGMSPMVVDGVTKVLAGITSVSEVIGAISG